MSDAPERIWARYSKGVNPYNGLRGLIVDNKPHEGMTEYAPTTLTAELAEARADVEKVITTAVGLADGRDEAEYIERKLRAALKGDDT